MLALRVLLCLAIICSTVSAQTLSTIALVVPLTQVTHTATQSGSWSSPQTWGNGIPPSGARVRIPAGFTITVDTCAYNVPFWVRVEGILRFAQSADTCLTVETVAVMHGGKLEMGTASDRITAKARLTFRPVANEPIDHLYDPFELSRGLIAEGLVEMHGQPKTPWVSVIQVPPAGSQTIALDTAPLGWVSGDLLEFTSPLSGQSERVTLAQVNGTVATLSAPLKNARPMPADCVTHACRLHLANLTRNVVVESDPAHAGNLSLQGHVMLMHQGGHRISYVEFADLGRTTIRPVSDPLVAEDGTRDPSLMPNCGLTDENVRGRYALHVHRAGPASPLSIVEGSVVHVLKGSGLKLGFVNHSSNVSMLGNVGVNIDGSTFFTEEGDEVGSFLGNLAIFSKGSDQPSEEQPGFVCGSKQYPLVHHRRRADVGHRGYGFWIHGGGVDVIDNVAADHGSAGFVFYSLPLNFRLQNTFTVAFPKALLRDGGAWWGKPTVPIQLVPTVFRRNTAYLTSPTNRWGYKAALAFHYHGLHQHTDAPGAPKNLIDGFLGWNTRFGLQTSYSGWWDLRNLVFLNGTAKDLKGGSGVGLNLSPQGGNHMDLLNIQAVGFQTCIRPPVTSTAVNVTCDGKPYP